MKIYPEATSRTILNLPYLHLEFVHEDFTTGAMLEAPHFFLYIIRFILIHLINDVQCVFCTSLPLVCVCIIPCCIRCFRKFLSFMCSFNHCGVHPDFVHEDFTTGAMREASNFLFFCYIENSFYKMFT